ncbi:Gfo/Idh/MocA family protein [Lacticaseibacillus brantae]|uniref:Dehydrogenase related protein n=1 Tax=Lacticaseibacillus brantae DSM 23927 TaxID=1423727 RepID=A0A0R2B0E6_9LACO|nr:Gfo/Idh/MocA family oxidoreductase [Lacticaseibacillus brantae]KRM72984.1 dehydrogenase related protein [Lacticaseibacillus brantae DSM 23927]
MLNIGVIGLGNIAQKAYLPVYAGLRSQVNWQIQTRDQDKLAAIGQQYGFKTTTSLASQEGLDAVMIHTPTATHYDLIRDFLLRGVNVYVDKPISENFAEVEDLYRLAADRQQLLTVGFNRRFAPINQELAQVADKNAVTVLKTRTEDLEDTKFALFDLMIHPVDTALFLAGFPDPQNVHYSLHQNKDHQLEQASVTFTGNGLRAEARVNMVAGTNYEEATVESSHGISRSINLGQHQQLEGQTEQVQAAPDWEPTLVTRGFDPLVRAFVQAIASHDQNPVSPESSLRSHKLIADLISQL